MTLSSRQAQVLRALLIEAPEFEPPEPPISVEMIAIALGIAPATVKEHLRRARRRDPEVYAAVMAHRRAQFDRWHAAVADARRERSRRWGKRRWAVRYRADRGSWPWEDLASVHRGG
jgi:DNA-binding Lrp family transcriptional regulator